jgi:hypothetical protein
MSSHVAPDSPRYKCFFSPMGSRCLRRDDTVVAIGLRTESDVRYAIQKDRAFLEGGAWHRGMPKASPEATWKRLRGFLQRYELRRAHLYPVMRKILGRLRDLQDPRQLSLRAFVVLPGGKV